MLKVLLISCVIFFCTSNAEITEEAKTATNEFTLDLLKEVLENRTGNAVVSPVNLYTLLAILQQGAGGNTREQIDYVLRAQPEVTKAAYKTLTSRYNGTFERTHIESATRVFADATYSLKSDFKNTLVDDFHSDIDTVYFNDPENASVHLNSWVTEATRYHIPQIFRPRSIPPTTALVLVNVLYFHGYLYFPFLREVDKAFHPSKDVEIEIPTMSHTEVYYAGECEFIGAKFVHMHFVITDEFTVLLVLPTERYGLDKLLNKMTPQNLTNMISHQDHKRVNLQLPQFRLYTDGNYREVLQRLGINEAFEDNADLTGITDQRIKVNKIIQLAEIALDRKGVTANLQTGETYFFIERDIVAKTVDNMDFIADHPFLFFIVDRTNHVPLFAGRVTEPSFQY